MNFNKNRSNRATEIKIDKSADVKGNKKGFRIIMRISTPARESRTQEQKQS